jgi:hypothetical protein
VFFIKGVINLNNSDSTTLILSSIAIAVSVLTFLVNAIIKFFWDDDWKRFCNKIYKLIGKRSSGVYYGTKPGISYEKMLFADAEQCMNLFYIICNTFLEERKELFIHNKINRKKLQRYVSNFKTVAKFLVDNNEIKVTENILRTTLLDYKFKSRLSIITPDQQSYIDEEYISRFHASNLKRCEFQDIVRLKGLTFDEVIEQLNLKMYIKITISTNDFLNIIFKDELFFFNSERKSEKYSFKYIHNQFYKKLKKEVLDYEKKFNHDDILKTMCFMHNEDHWIPVDVDTRLFLTPDKPYWNIDHYADEENYRYFVMKNNKIYDETLKKDLDFIYENREKYKSVINNSKFYRDIFGEIQ